MLKTIDHRTRRALQICIVFVSTLAIQIVLNFDHAGWIGFTVMMIYAGFDSGTSLHRCIHRFWGVMFGLLLSYILWFVIRIDYGLILLVIPIVVFMAFFSLGKYYVSPTIFTVTLTTLGVAYYTIDHYNVNEFFFDYARSTVFSLGICIFFEFFVFKKSNLTHKFYFELQRSLVCQLEQLFLVVITKPLRRSRYLKLSTQCNINILELRFFLNVVKHDYHVQKEHFYNLDDFNESVDQIYQNISQLFVNVCYSKTYYKPHNLVLETKSLLEKLFKISQEQFTGDVFCLE